MRFSLAEGGPHFIKVSFYIDPNETTQAEYARVMGENPSAFRGEDLPFESIIWLDAVVFANAKSADAGLTPAYTVSRCAAFFFYEIVLMTFAGTPPTTVFAGTSLCTTAPAATTAPSPIVTPCKIVAFAPIQTFSPM